MARGNRDHGRGEWNRPVSRRHDLSPQLSPAPPLLRRLLPGHILPARPPPSRDQHFRPLNHGIVDSYRPQRSPPLFRRRSRTPIDRDRRDRARSPLRRSPIPRGAAPHRPRSRSLKRHDSRFNPGPTHRRPSQPCERESAVTSAITSRSNSRSRAQSPRQVISPRPVSRGYDSRSRQVSLPTHSPVGLSEANTIPLRTSTPKNQTPLRSPRARSPPRDSGSLRAPLTGSSAARNYVGTRAAPTSSRFPASPVVSHARADVTSPTIPPAGPRGYVPSSGRGGSFGPRGGRGGWPSSNPRFAPSAQSSVTHHATTGANTVPTGPRASLSAATSPKPFNPPTGPAAQGGQRMSLAQNMIANMPPILPHGKIDPLSTPLTTGVIKELESHHRRLKEEEERIRADLRVKDEKLRAAMRAWERLEREAKVNEFRSEMSDRSLKAISGEGDTGSAF